MKKFVVLFVAYASVLFACKKDVAENIQSTSEIINASSVPAIVMSAFNSEFSGATEVEWRHSSDDDNFTSQFNHESQRHEARFDDRGSRQEHHVICLEAPVPQVVLDAFRKSFPQDVVYEWKFTSDNNWKAHFMRDAVKWEASYDSNGNTLKVEHD